LSDNRLEDGEIAHPEGCGERRAEVELSKADSRHIARCARIKGINGSPNVGLVAMVRVEIRRKDRRIEQKPVHGWSFPERPQKHSLSFGQGAKYLANPITLSMKTPRNTLRKSQPRHRVDIVPMRPRVSDGALGAAEVIEQLLFQPGWQVVSFKHGCIDPR
jgi:hypothetical protein